MRCHQCKRPISKLDEKKMKVERDEQGRIVSAYHYKCWFVREKHDRMGPGGRYIEDSPTAYEMAQRYRNRDDLIREEEAAKLAERQAVIAEETAKEPRPGAENDWRDPVTLDLDTLVAEDACAEDEHDWPAELTSDATCARCGLRYGEWSE